MNTTKEQRKQEAIKNLKRLGVCDGFIEAFEEHDYACMYENHFGYWAFQYPELQAKIKAFEEKHNATVYAVTHEHLVFGECYDFLFVSNHPEEWEYDFEEYEGDYAVFAYVWNKDDDTCSEFGTIVVRSRIGGLKRVG